MALAWPWYNYCLDVGVCFGHLARYFTLLRQTDWLTVTLENLWKPTTTPHKRGAAGKKITKLKHQNEERKTVSGALVWTRRFSTKYVARTHTPDRDYGLRTPGSGLRTRFHFLIRFRELLDPRCQSTHPKCLSPLHLKI